MDNWDYKRCLDKLKYKPRQNNCLELRLYEVSVYMTMSRVFPKTNSEKRIEQSSEMVLLVPRS